MMSRWLRLRWLFQLQQPSSIMIIKEREELAHIQVDGDLAINSMMWQNAGKSGLDQWNFTLQPTSKGQVMAPSSFLVSVTSCLAPMRYEAFSAGNYMPAAKDCLLVVLSISLCKLLSTIQFEMLIHPPR